MANKKGQILVTGGAGYIGSHTCVSLIQSGYSPVVVDDLSNSHISVIKSIETICNQPVTFYQEDISDHDAMTGIFQRHPVQAVIHLAAKKAVEESVFDPLLYYSSNVSAFVKLLALMREHAVKPLVYSSSATVYAPIVKGGIYNEDCLLGPVNPYGWTKFMGEQIVRDVEKTSAIVPAILRYFNPVGAHESGLIGEYPRGKPNNLMPLLAEVVLGRRDKLTIFGDDYNTIDGTAVRDFIHIMDLAEAHVRALDVLIEKSQSLTLNIGTGQGHSVKQIIESYQRVNNVTLPVVVGQRRAGDVANVCADVRKAKEVMGWVARRNLDSMCIDSHRWVMNLAREVC